MAHNKSSRLLLKLVSDAGNLDALLVFLPAEIGAYAGV
jgi:hypothetical protein